MNDRWIDLESSREDQEYYRRESDTARAAFLWVLVICLFLLWVVWQAMEKT